MQVRDIMIHHVYTAKPSTTVKELISLLETQRIGGVPVVDDNGHLVGIVSDGDIVRFLAPQDAKIVVAYYVHYVQEAQKIEQVLRERMNTPIEKIMVRKKHVKYVSPDDDFETAMRLLSKHHFKKVPVVNGAGRVVGVVSRGDVIHNLSKKIFEEETPSATPPFTTLVNN